MSAAFSAASFEGNFATEGRCPFPFTTGTFPDRSWSGSSSTSRTTSRIVRRSSSSSPGSCSLASWLQVSPLAWDSSVSNVFLVDAKERERRKLEGKERPKYGRGFLDVSPEVGVVEPLTGGVILSGGNSEFSEAFGVLEPS